MFNVRKASTTISINNIPKGVKKGGSFVPTYKYAGDGINSYVTSNTPNVCTVSGNMVSFVNGGNCTLTAHATDGKPQSFPVAK